MFWTVVGMVVMVIGGILAMVPTALPIISLDRTVSVIVGAALIVAGLATIVWLG